MVLQLHIWGPAFGLPSIDPECLATIAFISQVLDSQKYTLVQSSPSAVPTNQLPTLYDPATSLWYSGFRKITQHVEPAQTTQKPSPDASAYASYLSQHALPLLSLSLYVSSSNYTSTVRPAYSAILPFPLAWTEPPALRAAMVRRAEHLGMSNLDTDAEAGREEAAERAEAAAGWVQIPKGLLGAKRGVGEALAPEQRARIRLEGLAQEVLDVLADVEWDEQDPASQSLVWAYLALMAVPEVPRAWLREIIQRKYPGLATFVVAKRADWFAPGVKELPWKRKVDHDGAVSIVTRFSHGLVGGVPVLGEAWRRWMAGWRGRAVLRDEGLSEGPGELLKIAGAGLALLISAALWQKLPKLGAPVQIWERPIPGFLGMGAAGLMLGGLAGSDTWM